MTEAFPTLVALIRFFSSVNRLVFDKQGASPEGLPALLTHSRLFCSMNFLMLEEVFVKVEDCLASGTFVEFPSVSFLIPGEMKGSAETLTIFITFVGFATWGWFVTLNRL